MPKRILIFSTTYFPLVGGAEVAVKEITDRLSDWQFDLIAAKLKPDLDSFEKIGRANVYRVGWGCFWDKYLFPFSAYFKAKKLHKENNYQVVQAIMAFYAGLAALFFKWTYPETKYLLTMQSGDSDLFIWLRTWFWHPLYRKIYTKPDYIQAISRFLVKRARKYGYRGGVEIVPNGVDLNKFSISNSQFLIQNIKDELRIKPNEKIIITVSRLAKKNGVSDLIKAGKYLDFPFKILILGLGKEEKKLKKLAKKLNLRNEILFLGHVSHQELPRYYFMSDIFARPSLSEGLGNVFLEAMAIGVPIIGTPVGGIPDFLIDGETGLFCQVNNPQSIAEKIKQVLDDEQLREKIIGNGLKLVQKKYDWNLIAQKMEKIYLKLYD
jgi:glycosyltransferase involved in cell wall biosynthesis